MGQHVGAPRISRAVGRLGRPGVECRPPSRSLALIAALVAVVVHVDMPAVGFMIAPPSRGAGRRTVAMYAEGFSYGKMKGSKGFSESAEGDGNKKNAGDRVKKAGKAEGKDSTKIVKDKRSGKGGELTNTRLKDLRDKTLAVRQRREAELDEYEEGRALIAKYGRQVGVMPQKVAQRTAKRGVVIGGAFYGAMLALVAGGIILYKTQDLIIPPTLMAFGTLFLLGLAIFGSAYGMMSASWDPNKEGSLLGAEEFGENVKAIGEGFRRTSMQDEYDKALKLRSERRKLLAAKEQKKQELLNK